MSVTESSRMTSPVVDVEFAGGVELLFGNTKKLKVPLRSSLEETNENRPHAIRTVGDLLQTLKNTYLQQRPELFLQKENVRPGILVVVNDCDWELMGGPDYELQSGDKVVFISTLHGG